MGDIVVSLSELSEQRFAERWGHTGIVQQSHGHGIWHIHRDPVHTDADTKAHLFGRGNIGDAYSNEKMGVEASGSECWDGTSEDDLTCCLKMRTATFIELETSATAKVQKYCGVWVTRKRKASGSTRQWPSMKQDCSKVKEEHLGTQGAKEVKRREEYLVTQREELKCQVKADKATKTDLKDRFRAWMKICDEAQVVLEQNSFRWGKTRGEAWMKSMVKSNNRHRLNGLASRGRVGAVL